MQLIASKNGSLLELLRGLAPDSSQNTLRVWIAAGRVTVDGQRVERANAQVAAGQEVKVGPTVAFMREGIRILFEDDHIIVVEKPIALLSVATDFKNHSVHDFLKRRFHRGRVYPVHRLDRETSGVLIFTYSEEAQESLKVQFEQRLVDKTYYAIVEGKLPEKTGRWESYLEEDAVFFVRSTPHEKKGKLAITDYQVVSESERYSLLKMKLPTGRKNQLRVHCSEAGFPVVGDKKYGSKTNPIKRLCLHSQTISFKHPTLNKPMTFTTPLPDLFGKLVDISHIKI